MRKIAAVLLIVIASTSYAEQRKSKEKRFEAVVATAGTIAGSYRGPSESYGIILEVAPDGTLRGNYVEMGRVAVLNGIALNGSQISARASFDDGSSRTITGAFSKRTLNGNTALGLRLYEVPVEDLGRVDTFFERL